jgi:hypothetical protein
MTATQQVKGHGPICCVFYWTGRTYDMTWLTPELILQILGWLVAGAGAVWAVWAKVIPSLVENRIKALERAGELVADRAAHDLELEETYVGNLVQSAVTGQADLISTNNRLIAHLVESADREMMELRKEIQMLRGISIRGEGQLSLMNMEISRLVDTMHNLEKSLAIIKELMTAWVQTLPVMSDPEEGEGH